MDAAKFLHRFAAMVSLHKWAEQVESVLPSVAPDTLPNIYSRDVFADQAKATKNPKHTRPTTQGSSSSQIGATRPKTIPPCASSAGLSAESGSTCASPPNGGKPTTPLGTRTRPMADCERHDPKAMGTGRWFCNRCGIDLGPSNEPPRLEPTENIREKRDDES